MNGAPTSCSLDSHPLFNPLPSSSAFPLTMTSDNYLVAQSLILSIHLSVPTTNIYRAYSLCTKLCKESTVSEKQFPPLGSFPVNGYSHLELSLGY